MAPLLALLAALATPPSVHQTEDGRWFSTVDGAELVLVPGGSYGLGDADGRFDEQPPVTVTLSAFLIDRAEVTNAQFAAFVAASGHRPEGPWTRGLPPGGETLPVRFVTWHDAAAYAAWAGRRLPTEAEWEAAAGPHRYPWGDDWLPGRAVVGGEPSGGPEPAGRALDASPHGALNLAGNVREWVADWYDRFAWRALWMAGDVRDPSGPADDAPPEARFVVTQTVAGNERSTRKVVRGAGWAARHPDDARGARRGAENPRRFYDDVGFRCAVSLEGGR